MAGKNELIAINDKWRTAFSASLNDFENWILSAIIAPIHLIATNGTTVLTALLLFIRPLIKIHRCSDFYPSPQWVSNEARFSQVSPGCYHMHITDQNTREFILLLGPSLWWAWKNLLRHFCQIVKRACMNKRPYMYNGLGRSEHIYRKEWDLFSLVVRLKATYANFAVFPTVKSLPEFSCRLNRAETKVLYSSSEKKCLNFENSEKCLEVHTS